MSKDYLRKEFQELLDKAEEDKNFGGYRLLLDSSEIDKFTPLLREMLDSNMAIIHRSGNYAMLRFSKTGMSQFGKNRRLSGNEGLL